MWWRYQRSLHRMSQSQRHVDGRQKIGLALACFGLAFTNEPGQRASGHQGKGILVDQATECWSARTLLELAAQKWRKIFGIVKIQCVIACQGVAKSCKISRPCCSHWGHLGTTITAGFYGKTTTRRGGQWIVFASCSKIHKDHQTSTSHSFT